MVEADRTQAATVRSRSNDPRALPATVAAVLLLIAVAGSKTRPTQRPIKSPPVAKHNGARTQMLIEVTKTLIGGIENGLVFYWAEHNGFPDGNGTDVLRRLANPLKDEFGYLEDPWITGHTDPWGNPFHYRWPHPHANKPAIWSSGPNGINEHGGGDDVRNW